jgi:peptidoglycan hydrolase-like protein with peptidoglycan-binding domain
MKDIRDKKAHIFDIQRRLYLLRKSGLELPLVVPDGIYGERTRDAVRAFSLISEIDEGDIVDLELWRELTKRSRYL